MLPTMTSIHPAGGRLCGMGSDMGPGV
jgi:hypothetical protein